MRVTGTKIELTDEEEIRYEVRPEFQALIQNQAHIVSKEHGRKPVQVFRPGGTQRLGMSVKGKWVDG